jgi:hypothetical protein
VQSLRRALVELRARLPLRFVPQSSRKASGLYAAAELAITTPPPIQLARGCKVDTSDVYRVLYNYMR